MDFCLSPKLGRWKNVEEEEGETKTGIVRGRRKMCGGEDKNDKLQGRQVDILLEVYLIKFTWTGEEGEEVVENEC